MCSNMDGPRHDYTKWYLSEKWQISNINNITYMWNPFKKVIEMNFFTKQKPTHRHRKQAYAYHKGGGSWGGIN